MYMDQVRTLFNIMDEARPWMHLNRLVCQGQSGELTAHAFEEYINEPQAPTLCLDSWHTQVAAYFRALDMDLNNAWKLLREDVSRNHRRLRLIYQAFKPRCAARLFTLLDPAPWLR